MPPIITPQSSLAFSPTAFLYEGFAHEEPGIDASVFDTRTPPGRDVGLHTHPYPELFLVDSGEVQFQVGDEEFPVAAGSYLIVPAGIPHGFVNTGTEISRVLSVHGAGRMEQTWLEEETQ